MAGQQGLVFMINTVLRRPPWLGNMVWSGLLQYVEGHSGWAIQYLDGHWGWETLF